MGGAHRDGLLHEQVEELATMPREASVETRRELIEIRLQVRERDSTLVSASQPAFDQGGDQMNVVELF